MADTPPFVTARPDALSARTLDDGRVDLWFADLSLPAREQRELDALLTPDETARAERFRFAEHRRRFSASRGLLRLVLSCYLGMPPARIELEYTKKGKPRLAGSQVALQFNLAHSGPGWLLGLTRSAPVGVDLEQQLALDDAMAIAKRFFARRESAAIQELPPAERLRAFYRIWTRKEALLKATGLGITGGLRRFVVGHGREAQLFRAPDDPEHWSLTNLEPTRDYVGAIALRARGYRLYARSIDAATIGAGLAAV